MESGVQRVRSTRRDKVLPAWDHISCSETICYEKRCSFPKKGYVLFRFCVLDRSLYTLRSGFKPLWTIPKTGHIRSDRLLGGSVSCCEHKKRMRGSLPAYLATSRSSFRHEAVAFATSSV
jgi:hypothetical protein